MWLYKTSTRLFTHPRCWQIGYAGTDQQVALISGLLNCTSAEHLLGHDGRMVDAKQGGAPLSVHTALWEQLIASI